MERDFVKKKPNKGKNKAKSFEENLELYRNEVKQSMMFEETVKKLEPFIDDIINIRCLAIGSFTEDFPARYQLALLLELHEHLGHGGRKISVSLFDPVFTLDDTKFIQKMGSKWVIEENISEASSWNATNTLFFLPHAPLDLTEQILIKETPKYWLANNIIQHTDRYTKLQLHEKFPVLSKLVYLLEKNEKEASKKKTATEHTTDKGEGFSTFVSKRKRKSKSTSKYIFKDPEIDYLQVSSYFNDCKILSDFESGNLVKDKPWINSFSDLTLHYID